jgi:ribonuclease HII
MLVQSGVVEYGVSAIDAERVDQINILRATTEAMLSAVKLLQPPPEHLLVDGRPVAALGPNQTALVKGDSLSYSIAAASVLAKVTRDRLMMQFDQQFPEYGFAVHKGYGTAQHLEALSRHGPCPIHRRTFAPMNASRQGELFGFE